jgi:uncharacterized protein (DUF58 family)
VDRLTESTLFDAGFLSRLESLSLLARKIQRGRLRAERRSIQRGASVEFAEYRPFVNGDDFRYIDWNAFARWRQLVMKLFVEEEDLHVNLLLDCSASMRWGEPDKFDFARRVVAGLAYIGLANLDRISITPIGARSAAALPSGRGKHRFLQVLQYLEHCPTATGPVVLADEARTWTASRPRRGLVVWVGDLWGADREDVFRAFDRLRHARHEIAVLQVRDRAEAEAGAPGEYEFEDVETGLVRKVIVSPEMAKSYRARFVQYQDALQAYTRRHQMALLAAETTMDPADLLQRALVQGGFVK